jgi:hypothetical protein
MKTEHKELLRERARDALRALYHNATPDFPRDLRGRTEDYAQAWFDDAAEQEIDYLRGGGAYGRDYRKTLAADCNAGRYKSERARAYYVAKGMRAMHAERADCGAFTGWNALENAALFYGRRIVRAQDSNRNNAQWERIGEFGQLYQYGRGGRTLAPDGLIRQHGGSSFSVREDYADDLSRAEVVDLIRVLESFNAYVETWNGRENLEYMWREHCDTEDAEEERQAALREYARTIKACFC